MTATSGLPPGRWEFKNNRDAFPDDGSALVAPVGAAGSASRQVYLPAGGRMNYNDRTTIYHGPTKISAEAPLGMIPLFVREGAIIPRGDILKANNNWDADWTPKLRSEFFPSSFLCVSVVKISSPTRKNEYTPDE